MQMYRSRSVLTKLSIDHKDTIQLKGCFHQSGTNRYNGDVHNTSENLSSIQRERAKEREEEETNTNTRNIIDFQYSPRFSLLQGKKKKTKTILLQRQRVFNTMLIDLSFYSVPVGTKKRDQERKQKENKQTRKKREKQKQKNLHPYT